MKQYIMYVCETCGEESRDFSKIKKCEADHLGLTLEEKNSYDTLKKKAEMCGATLSRTKNEETDKDFDDAIDALILFEKEHGVNLPHFCKA